MIELGPYKTGNFAPRNTYDHINFFDDTDHYDFPIALHVSRFDDIQEESLILGCVAKTCL